MTIWEMLSVDLELCPMRKLLWIEKLADQEDLHLSHSQRAEMLRRHWEHSMERYVYTTSSRVSSILSEAIDREFTSRIDTAHRVSAGCDYLPVPSTMVSYILWLRNICPLVPLVGSIYSSSFIPSKTYHVPYPTSPNITLVFHALRSSKVVPSASTAPHQDLALEWAEEVEEVSDTAMRLFSALL